eukprot:5011767-Karenia_brevis.AAC.1
MDQGPDGSDRNSDRGSSENIEKVQPLDHPSATANQHNHEPGSFGQVLHEPVHHINDAKAMEK